MMKCGGGDSESRKRVHTSVCSGTGTKWINIHENQPAYHPIRPANKPSKNDKGSIVTPHLSLSPQKNIRQRPYYDHTPVTVSQKNNKQRPYCDPAPVSVRRLLAGSDSS